MKYRRLGIFRQLAWEDITDIAGREVPAWVSRDGARVGYETMIVVTGRNTKIGWTAVFEVTQDALLTYLYSKWHERTGRHKVASVIATPETETLWKPSKVLTFLVTFLILVILVVLRLNFPNWSF